MARPDKRASILQGALTVFARDGYARASIDAISAEAGVSTRTIYNHFQDKADLFQAVIRDSAAGAAEAEIAIIDRYLTKVTDLEPDLVEFGMAMVEPMSGATAVHFRLVRQINADRDHIPKRAIEAWQETGPLRVRRALGERLREWDKRGLLTVDDPERAALHLMLLISGDTPSTKDTVASGIHTFLYGYQKK